MGCRIIIAMKDELVEELTLPELRALIDAQAQSLLGMSGDECRRLYYAGGLPDVPTARILVMLLELERDAADAAAA